MNREENVMMEEVKKLFSGEEISKNGIIGINPPAMRARGDGIQKIILA